MTLPTITDEVTKYQFMSANYAPLERQVKDYKDFKKKILRCFTNEELRTEVERRKLTKKKWDWVK